MVFSPDILYRLAAKVLVGPKPPGALSVCACMLVISRVVLIGGPCHLQHPEWHASMQEGCHRKILRMMQTIWKMSLMILTLLPYEYPMALNLIAQGRLEHH